MAGMYPRIAHRTLGYTTEEHAPVWEGRRALPSLQIHESTHCPPLKLVGDPKLFGAVIRLDHPECKEHSTASEYLNI